MPAGGGGRLELECFRQTSLRLNCPLAALAGGRIERMVYGLRGVASLPSCCYPFIVFSNCCCRSTGRSFCSWMWRQFWRKQSNRANAERLHGRHRSGGEHRERSAIPILPDAEQFNLVQPIGEDSHSAHCAAERRVHPCERQRGAVELREHSARCVRLGHGDRAARWPYLYWPVIHRRSSHRFRNWFRPHQGI